MKIPYKERFDPSELPEGIIAIPFRYGPAYTGLINGRKLFTKEQYLQALESERLELLYSRGTLFVEYRNQAELCDKNFYEIDISKTVGRVYALDDDNLYIKKGINFDELIPEDIRSNLFAFLRCIVSKSDYNTFEIIGWDIQDGTLDILNSQIRDYLEEHIPAIVDICTTKEDSQEVKAEFRDNLMSYFVSNMIYGKGSIHEILAAIRRSKEYASNIKQASNSCEAMYMEN